MSYTEGFNKDFGLVMGENVFVDENGLVKIGMLNISISLDSSYVT